MIGTGTIINVAAIIIGGGIGLLFGRSISDRLRETLLMATGVAIVVMGLGGALAKMLTVDPATGQVSAQGVMMMIVSLAAGAVIGELLDINGAIVRFGQWLKEKSGSNGAEGGFVPAFVNCSCTVCIGAMAVVGSIEDALGAGYTTLATKSLLDMIFVAIMTASQGVGCVFSAAPVALFQGGCTLAAVFAGSFMNEAMLSNLSYVGNVLIAIIGLNIIRPPERTIRVANLLPAILVAVIWGKYW